MLGAFGEITARRASDLDAAELAFRVAAADLYPAWLEELRSFSGLPIQSGRGTFVVASGAGRQDRANVQSMLESLKVYRRSCELVDPSLIPHYRPHPSFAAHSALFIADEGYVNTADLMSALAAALDRAGNVRAVDEPVRKLLLEGDAVVGAETVTGRSFWADRIVLAAGTGIQPIVEESGASIRAAIPRLMPGKGVSVVLEAEQPLEFVIRTPNRDFSCGTHIVPRQANAIYLGATNRIANTPGAADGVTCGEIQNLLYSAIHEIDTRFRTANIVSTAYGSRPIALDRFPVVGPTSVRGLFVATGTYRNGVLMAPLIAELVADAALNRPARLDHPFAPDDPRRRVAVPTVPELIADGVADLVSFIREPNGFLPYGRARELQDFIEVLLTCTLADGHGLDQRMADAKRLLQEYPVPEIIPQLFYSFHQLMEDSRLGATSHVIVGHGDETRSS